MLKKIDGRTIYVYIIYKIYNSIDIFIYLKHQGFALLIIIKKFKNLYIYNTFKVLGMFNIYKL